ncbi:uncharacterized protein C8A04DRAFT_9290 [Dichotomopilus funicola]|uniref:HNH nuclease domain-containing protein n=1 Tax=Dichotomopilus funicola TaxID=1934379 RepID=A0AAN6ZR48_9PEZI|nr:hypothetical protein C8A04DRAFT_9290 [Dichotomopilus funicola]
MADSGLGSQHIAKLITAAHYDREGLVQFLDDNPPPHEPVVDYITDTEVRRALFDRYRTLRQGDPPAVILAVFMVAPVGDLRDCLERINQYPPNAKFVCRDLDREVPGALGVSNLNEPGMPVAQTTVTGSGFAERVKTRDGHVCLFSGTSDPEAAHIFPFSASKNKNLGSLNDMVSVFWSHEKEMAWRRMYEQASIANSAKNGISLNRQLHFWFNRAVFALEPLRKTQEGITVKWHWLKKSPLLPRFKIHSHEDILLQAGLVDLNWGQELAHRESGVKIRNGQTFLFRQHAEMPSWELLELQWNLLRISAICGAAEVKDDYERYYDPNEDPDELGYHEGVAAKQNAIIEEYQRHNKGKLVGTDEDNAGDWGEVEKSTSPPVSGGSGST